MEGFAVTQGRGTFLRKAGIKVLVIRAIARVPYKFKNTVYRGYQVV